MRRILVVFSLIASASIVATPCASASTIEDGGFGGVSNLAASIIYNDHSFDVFRDLSCRIVGEKIALSNASAVTAYFITTADGCGWGLPV